MSKPTKNTNTTKAIVRVVKEYVIVMDGATFIAADRARGKRVTHAQTEDACRRQAARKGYAATGAAV